MNPEQQANALQEAMNHPEVREELLDALRRRLVGPAHGEEEELVGEVPTENYISGTLSPLESEVPEWENEDTTTGGSGGQDGDPERSVSAALSNSFKPSSIGLTCLVEEGTDQLLCRPAAAWYEEIEPSEAEWEPEEREGSEEDEEGESSGGEEEGGEEDSDEGDEDGDDEDEGRTPDIFKRRPLEIDPLRIDITQSSGRETIADGRAEIAWIVRPAKRVENAKVVTVSLVNTQRDPESPFARVVEAHLFQASLKLEGISEGGRPFMPRTLADRSGLTGEDVNLELLYRDRPPFATGHGCAAVWEDDADDRAAWVSTKTVPAYEVPKVEAVAEGDHLLGMKALTEAEPGTLERELGDFLDDYEAWIEDQGDEAERTLTGELLEQARENIEQCRTSLRKMRQGIELLTESEAALESFRIMNRVIRGQLIEEIDGEPEWRPFQLAFILQSLEGGMGRTVEDEPVHTLWFPTGGGKTEAYLGLAAFTIAHRRITGDERAGGVTVLMRYTLRLLTIQQFQRAAGVICELERMRRTGEADLGEDEISIGLWVGTSSAPNWLGQAERQLKRSDDTESTPEQLQECPSCGADLTLDSYEIPRGENTLKISCPNSDCEFSDRLPVYTVDEELYWRCPTLVIGTVDKFARLPWEERTKALFGQVSHRCDSHSAYNTTAECGIGESSCSTSPVDGLRPPDLVIQDELHLISGPLGTMVGVYEALIDFLSRQDGRPPLVVASSATIRRADVQCRNLYNRDVAIFPPRATTDDDTFFSRVVPLDEEPGRLYVGVLPAGFSMKTALVRIYGSLLTDTRFGDFCPSEGTEEGDHLRDPYWTLIAYFNSLRELGGAIRLVEDDVPAYMQVASDDVPRGFWVRWKELTGRRKGSEIPDMLDQMGRSLRDHDRKEVLDMVFATNMISVGVDVPRLGLMVVSGQPKATAEYIQSTSRIGRKYPGLVVTLYNWARPRDRSHYEDFTDYHSSLYRHVEANSVTPYTEPALKRGLHALLVAAVRLLEDGMGPNGAAGKFDRNMETVQRLKDFLEERLKDPRREDDQAERVREFFERAVDDWAEHARLTDGDLSYQGDESESLLIAFEVAGEDSRDGMPTLNSLRSVEPEVGMEILPEDWAR